MTCIAGVVENGKVWIGGDSCASTWNSWVQVGNPKVFQVGEFLIGSCGSMRMMDLLAFELIGCVQRPEEPDDRFVRTTFINTVKRCFKDGNYGSDSEGGNFLLGYRGNLYEIQNDFSVLKCPPWGMAIGSGGDVARGSLWTLASIFNGELMVMSAENKIKSVLESAEAVVPSVRGPFVIMVK